MHHTNVKMLCQFGCLVLALLLGGAVVAQNTEQGSARAEQQLARKTIVLPVNGTQNLQLTPKRPIKEVRVAKPNVARASAKDENTVLLTGLEPGVTQVTLADTKGVEESFEIVVQLDVDYLKTLLARVVPTANIQPIPGPNNMVILSGTVAHAEDIDVAVRTTTSVVGGADKVVNALRLGGVQQVQLEVTVARVSRTKLRLLSFDFLNIGQHHVLNSSPSGGLIVPFTAINGDVSQPASILNSVGLVNGRPNNLFLGVFNDKQAFFGLLQALKDEQVAKLHAEPSLLALSGRPASFLSGGEQAVPVPAGLGQIGVQFEEFGTRLNFVPIVLGSGRIYLEVEPEVSSLNIANGVRSQGLDVPGRDTQRAHTSMIVESGQTFVIAGLIQNTVQATITKVPVLGELPFLGAAFSTKNYREVEDEVVILVTPHLVDPMACNQVPKVLPGQETRSPDDFELFLEGILEAPRGPRTVFQNHHYVPAYKNGPTADKYPTTGRGRWDQTGIAPKHSDGPAKTSPQVSTAAEQGRLLVPAEELPAGPSAPVATEFSKPKELPAISSSAPDAAQKPKDESPGPR